MRLLACALILAPSLAVASETDPWFGTDKALHFGASAALAAGGYGLGSAIWEERAPRFALGAGVALAAGLGKEAADLAGAGHPSWRDLAWDVVGTSAGLLVAWGVDLLVSGPDAGAHALIRW